MVASSGSPLAQTMSQRIAEALVRRINAGEYEMGARLPTERELAQEFSVTRHVVREALKRLEAVGLLRIRQGSGIYVQGLQLMAGVEVFDVLLHQEDGSLDLAFLGDVFDFRDHEIRVMVRLAALNHTEAEIAAMRELTRARRGAADKPERALELTSALFEAIAKATHNKLYVMVFNTLGHVLIKLRAEFDIPLLGFEQTQESLERTVEAIGARDPDKAETMAMRQMQALREVVFGAADAASTAQ